MLFEWLRSPLDQPTSTRSRSSLRQWTRLTIERLEDRLAPVIGVYDVPYAVDTNAVFNNVDLSALVAVDDDCSGAVIAPGGIVEGSRYILTAAHCMDVPGPLTQDVTVSFYLRRNSAVGSNGDIKQIAIPGRITRFPGYNPATQRNDIAVITLESVVPFGVQGYEIRRTGGERGQIMTIAGFGTTGTGITGENQRGLQVVHINATSGQFFFTYSGIQGTTALPSSADAATIASALRNDFPQLGTLDVAVFPAGPHAGSFQIWFGFVEENETGVDEVPMRLGFASNPNNPLMNGAQPGTVDVTALAQPNDPEFQRLTVSATAGTYRLQLGNNTTIPIAFNADAKTIQNAIEAALVLQATVRQVPAGLPGAGSFEISFDRVNGTANIPQMTADTSNLTGNVSIGTIQDAGRPVLRWAQNQIDDAFEDGGTSFTITLDGNVASDGIAGSGDSGGPALLTIDGSTFLAGPVCCGGEVIGDSTFYSRTTSLQSFVDRLVNASGYTLKLDMSKQLAGDDGQPDAITAEVVDGNVVLRVNGDIYYRDRVGKVRQVVIQGSGDDDTITIAPSLSRNVTVNGGGGTNHINVELRRAGTRTVTASGSDIATDHVTIDGTDFVDVFAVNAVRVARGSEVVRYTNMDSLTVNGGKGNDVFVAASTAKTSTGATLTRLDGGEGADRVTVSGNLDNIQGPLSVIGGPQLDLLIVNDLKVGDVSFSITGTQVANGTGTTRTFAGIAYDATTENLRVRPGSGKHTYDVAPSLDTEYLLLGRGLLNDLLQLDTNGTTGATKETVSPGLFAWTFTSGHKRVVFRGMTSS